MCRTANGYDINGFAQLKDGRGNICPSTIIMPTLAMEADRDVGKFLRLLKKKIEECKDSLIDRFEWICSQPADSAKFMYENGTMAGYIEKDGIRSALKHGTLAIGNLGLAETLELLVGCNHTKPEGMKLAKKIYEIFRDKCAEYKEQVQHFKVTDDQLKHKMIYLAEKELGRPLTEVEISDIVEKIKNP